MSVSAFRAKAPTRREIAGHTATIAEAVQILQGNTEYLKTELDKLTLDLAKLREAYDLTCQRVDLLGSRVDRVESVQTRGLIGRLRWIWNGQ